MGLSVAFDLATHRGYDSDHPRVVGDVGKAGVAIDSVEDMKILFDGIPLDKMTVSMTMNGAVLPVLAGYIVAAEEQGVDAGRSSAGPSRTTSSRSSWSATPTSIRPTPSMRIVADIIEYTAQHMPKFNSISISGYHMQEAGATAVQELAFTLADGLEYVRAALGTRPRHRRVRRAAVVLLRHRHELLHGGRQAARRPPAVVAGDRPVRPEEAAARSMLRTHCQTSGVSLTEQDPYNNIVRTTIEALAAVLGGTQSLHTNSFDEAIALPSEFAARIARNTQLILAEETGITHVVDPLGGSYYVEALTASLANEAWKLIEEVEALGGMTKAVESGMPKLRIEEAAARTPGRASTAATRSSSASTSTASTRSPTSTFRDVDNAEVREQQTRPARARCAPTRDDARVPGRARRARARAPRGDGNLLELSIEATRARATVGEISDAMEEVFSPPPGDDP